MSRKHTIWDSEEKELVHIPFTVAEEDAQDAQNAAWEEDAPFRADQKVKDDIARLDGGMARITEDIAVAMITGKPLPQAARDKINARRRLRGEPDV